MQVSAQSPQGSHLTSSEKTKTMPWLIGPNTSGLHVPSDLTSYHSPHQVPSVPPILASQLLFCHNPLPPQALCACCFHHLERCSLDIHMTPTLPHLFEVSAKSHLLRGHPGPGPPCLTVLSLSVPLPCFIACNTTRILVHHMYWLVR